MQQLVTAGDATARVLADAVRGRTLSQFERTLIEVLHEPIFRRVDNLRASEACALSYRRLRHLRERMSLNARSLLSNFDQLLALHEWVAMVDGTMVTILTIHFNLCMGSIYDQGEGRAELRPILDELSSMQTFGVFLATELAFGNNVQAMETEAVYDHQTRAFRLHTPRREAQKFMPNTGADGVPKLAVVLARLKVAGKRCGVFPFIVRIRDEQGLCEGVHVSPLGDKPDYALDNAITWFEQVHVPFHHWLSGAENRIDEQGKFVSAVSSIGRRFLTSMARVQTGKLCISAGGLGMMRGALDLTLRYAQQRNTFGPGRREVPILAYRTYQHAVFEGVASAYACGFLLQHAASEQSTVPGHDVAINRLLAIAKVFVSSSGIDIISQCRERVGAQGMFSSNRMISYLVHTNGVITAEGDNEILLVKMGRELLLGEDYELPAPLTADAPALLESPDYLLSLLRERERLKVLRLRDSFMQRGALGGVFDGWNDHISDAVELATIHVHRIAMETFNRRLDSVDEPATRDVLERMLRLCLLKEVAEHAASLLVDDVLERSLADGISAERRRLASSFAHEANALIDGFGIPTSLLAAPIASDYIGSYDRMSSLPPARESGIQLRTAAEPPPAGLESAG